MLPLTDDESKSNGKQKVCSLSEKEFNTDKNDINKNAFNLYHKVRGQCHYTGKYRWVAYNICNLRCKTSKQIPAVGHNGSTYDHHFIIK